MCDLTEYWEAQLRAALDSMDPDTELTRRENADDIVVCIVGDSDREDRAELTSALEQRGFTVVSTTTENYVRVDATAEPLNHPYTDEVTP